MSEALSPSTARISSIIAVSWSSSISSCQRFGTCDGCFRPGRATWRPSSPIRSARSSGAGPLLVEQIAELVQVPACRRDMLRCCRVSCADDRVNLEFRAIAVDERVHAAARLAGRLRSAMVIAIASAVWVPVLRGFCLAVAEEPNGSPACDSSGSPSKSGREFVYRGILL